MRKRVYKLFWIWDFDKEEKWLNEMAARGLALISAGLCRYEFEETLPGEYSVRMQMLEHRFSRPETERYIAFLEETGVEHVGICKKWAYFRKKKADGAFELFSDNESRVRHLTRILRLIVLLGVLNLWVGVWNLFMYGVGRMAGNLIGLFNLTLGLLCFIGANRLRKKAKRLRQEQQIFE